MQNDKEQISSRLLFATLFSGNTVQAQQAIAAGANVNMVGGDLLTLQLRQFPLFLASYRGDLAMVELLIHHGAHVNKKTGDGSTALMVAAQQGHSRIVEHLINHHAEVNAADNDGETPLFVAAGFGHTDIVLLLLKAGAHVNLTNSNDRGATALFIACQHGHARTVAALLVHGALINLARKSDGLSSLAIAEICKQTFIIHLLKKWRSLQNKLGASNSTNPEKYIENSLELLMTYQENFIADVTHLLFTWKRKFKENSYEHIYINQISSALHDIIVGDDFFKKLRTALSDTTSNDYRRVKDILKPMRIALIDLMNLYNRDKKNSATTDASNTSEPASRNQEQPIAEELDEPISATSSQYIT